SHSDSSRIAQSRQTGDRRSTNARNFHSKSYSSLAARCHAGMAQRRRRYTPERGGLSPHRNNRSANPSRPAYPLMTNPPPTPPPPRGLHPHPFRSLPPFAG